MFVSQLDEAVQNKVKKIVRVEIQKIGFYTDAEVEFHVQRAMDSKIHDLEELVNIKTIKGVAL